MEGGLPLSFLLPWEEGEEIPLQFHFPSAPPSLPRAKLSCFVRETVGFVEPSQDSVVKIQYFVLRPSCKALPLWETVNIYVLFFLSFFFVISERNNVCKRWELWSLAVCCSWAWEGHPACVLLSGASPEYSRETAPETFFSRIMSMVWKLLC